MAIPVAVSVFADEIYAAPKRWVQNAYPRLIHYNRLPKGRSLCTVGAAAGAFGCAAREFPRTALNGIRAAA